MRWKGDSAPTTPIVHYDVRYRFANGSWVTWKTKTTQLSALFTDVGPDDGNYCFQVRATDSTGWTSDYSQEQCMSIDREPPFFEPQSYLPVVISRP